MTVIERARVALAAHEARSVNNFLTTKTIADDLADALRALVVEHEREPRITDEMVDAAAQSLTGLSDELWAANRSEPHVSYYIDAARAALQAAEAAR